MKNEEYIGKLQEKGLKEKPFNIPEGYFSSFPERMQDRIRKEEAEKVPVRSIGRSVWMGMAAAILGAALITTFLLRTVFSDSAVDYSEMALMEELEGYRSDLYFYELANTDEEVLNDEEAFARQAEEYLASTQVEYIIFE